MKKVSFGQILDLIFFALCVLAVSLFYWLDYIDLTTLILWLPILIKLFDISSYLEDICKSSGKKSVDNK